MYYKRKTLRLSNYDYSKNGMYFITICTYKQNQILCKIYNNVGAGCHPCPKIKIQLSEFGKCVENEIKHQNIDTYVIMPDHVHFIIQINHNNIQTQGRDGTLPLHAIIGQFKSYTTKNIMQ